MLYPNPKNMFLELLSNKKEDAGNATYLSCPASSNKFKNTYIFSNALESKYSYDFTNNQQIINPISKDYLNYSIPRPPTTNTGPLIQIHLGYIFFSDEPLVATFTPPMFHKPQYTNYGSVCPGDYDIGQWYRPYPLEIQMWDNKGEFYLKYGEPIFYVEFKTDKKINLVRYTMNNKLYSLSAHCVDSTNYWGRGLPLIERYRRFKSASMREIILKEIKNNLIDQEL